MRRRKSNAPKNTQEWLTTYSDMVTLLLCFFVLLFSFSNIDAQKFKSIMKSFQGGAGVLNGSPSIDVVKNKSSLDEKELEKLKDVIEEYKEKNGLGEKITLSIEERGLVIRFMDSIFFDSGKAKIKPKSKEVLHYVAKLLNKDEFKDKYIKVEGHTDTDRIVYSDTYDTNWELSAIRATNVLRYLVEKEHIDGDRVSSSGYSFYRAIVPNDTKEHKAQNRRVDIVILKSSYEKWEPK